MWWDDSNLGDRGATAKQSFFMKFFHGKRPDNIKVNTENPVAKQRGTDLVIFDVTNLELSSDEKKEFSLAVAKYYESNFWIKFKSVSMMIWITTVLASSLKSYKSYKNLKDPMSHWKSQVFLFLELVDQAKDVIYLYGQPHHPIIALLFSQTMILPFIINVWATNVVEYTYNGQPRKVRELPLIFGTFPTHFGCERKEDGQGDIDFPERRYRASKNTKLIENILQMALILIETFSKDDTITF